MKIIKLRSWGVKMSTVVYSRRFGYERGAAVLESVIVLPILFLAVTSILVATQLFLVSLKVEQAAVVGAVTLYQSALSTGPNTAGVDPGVAAWANLHYGGGSEEVVNGQKLWLTSGASSNGWDMNQPSHRIFMNALLGTLSFLGVGASPPVWEGGKAEFSKVHLVTLEPEIQNKAFRTIKGQQVPTKSDLLLHVTVPLFDRFLEFLGYQPSGTFVKSKVELPIALAMAQQTGFGPLVAAGEVFEEKAKYFVAGPTSTEKWGDKGNTGKMDPGDTDAEGPADSSPLQGG